MKKLTILLPLALLAACSDAPVENKNDSAAVDSAAMIADTTLPRPVSKTLDTIQLKVDKKIQRQTDGQIAQAMAKNTPEGWAIMDTMTGDLNRDEYLDMLIVLKGPHDEDRDSLIPRPLLVLTGNKDGTLTLEARNDNVVLCHECGGVFGDPYEGLAIKNGYFSAEHYGGSSERWTQIITFRYNEKEKTWLLHRDAGVTYSVFDPDMTEKEYVNHPEAFGKLKFTDYNYN